LSPASFFDIWRRKKTATSSSSSHKVQRLYLLSIIFFWFWYPFLIGDRTRFLELPFGPPTVTLFFAPKLGDPKKPFRLLEIRKGKDNDISLQFENWNETQQFLLEKE